MSTKELYRNGSGYIDPTAGKALKSVTRLVDGIAVKRGSIWSAYFGDTPRTCLVVATYYEHASILVLNDEQRGSGSEPLTTASGRVYYATPAMLSYKFYTDFDHQEDALEREERERVLDLIAGTLGIPTQAPAPKPAKHDDADALRVELENTRKAWDAAEKKITELTVARDLYREEYRELQARLIGK